MKMELLKVIILLTCLVASNASLLEMSQTLWKRLLDGGLDKAGQLDPLRVPVIKVDQSEGNTTYRITLRNVEIGGLNASTLDSVHVARGKLKSNFSELEAGYVTYTDLKDLDTIRYRFHTMVKEDNKEAEEEQKKEEASSQRNSDRSYSRFDSDEDDYSGRKKFKDSRKGSQDRNFDEGQRFSVDVMESSRDIAPGVHIIYAQKMLKADDDDERETNEKKDEVECLTDCKRLQDPRGRLQQQQQQFNQQRNYNYNEQYQQYNNEQRNYTPHPEQYNQQQSYNQQQNYPQRKAYDQTQSPYEDQYKATARPTDTYEDKGGTGYKGSQNTRFGDSRYEYRETFGAHSHHPTGTIGVKGGTQRNYELSSTPVYSNVGYSNKNRPSERFGSTQYSNQNSDTYSDRVSSSRDHSQNSELVIEKVHDREGSMTVKFLQGSQRSRNNEFPSRRQESKPQPGFIDIIYADGKGPEGTKRFGNLKVDPDNQDVKVYGLKDLLKDIRENGRYIVHNFTKGESLAKRNDLARVAEETRRIKDLVRYARNHQESQGYFEEGMELIYHYGDDNNRTKVDLPARKKRAHDNNDKEEDDVMHVILRIRVPVLHVKANYALTGKVGNEVVRGNGLLTGNFTDLIGDFMVELKKAGEDSMVVRAARAKLFAKDRNVSLEGLEKNEQADVILAHGLMAAEAVAAMIADDLATKALNERIADATVYKMYKNLPKEG